MTIVKFALMPWECKNSVIASACSIVCKWSLQVKSNNQKWIPQGLDAKIAIVIVFLINEQHNLGEFWANASNSN